MTDQDIVDSDMNARESQRYVDAGEHGQRSLEEWAFLKQKMKEALVHVARSITGCTFPRFQVAVKEASLSEFDHFAGEHIIYDPHLNIVYWSGISKLAAESILELCAEGRLRANPTSRALYMMDGGTPRELAELPRPRGFESEVQQVTSWVPLEFWHPELWVAKKVGGVRINGQLPLLEGFVREGGEILWKGRNVLEGARVVSLAQAKEQVV